jgi:Helicase HerA, central domain/TraM recognition site of TraD and TraG
VQVFWIAVAITGGTLVIGGMRAVRAWGQGQLDGALVTYEQTFPRDLDDKTSARLASALGSLYGKAGRLGTPFGRNTVVAEILSTPDKLRFLLSFPPHKVQAVESQLTGVVRNIGLTEFTDELNYEWKYVNEVKRDSRITEGSGDPKPRPIDPKTIEALLRSMRHLNKGEAVIIQLIMTPADHITGADRGIRAVIRVAAAGHDIRAQKLVGDVLSAYRPMHVFLDRRLIKPLWKRVALRTAPSLDVEWGQEYAPGELAVMAGWPIGNPVVPGLVLGRRKLAPDAAIPHQGIVLGESNYPGSKQPIALLPRDLTRHMHIIGATGTGKSTQIENQIVQAVEQGYGVTFLDPHGDSFRNVLDRIPPKRVKDVILLDVTDSAMPVGFNVLSGDPYIVTNQVMAVFDRLYDIFRMAQTADVLRSTVLTLAQCGMTLLDIPAVLSPTTGGQRLRDHLVSRLTDEALKDFWQQYDGLRDAKKHEIIAPVLRRLRPFETWPSLRGCLGQAKSGFDFDDVFARNKIILVNLSKGQIGEEEHKLFGSLFIARFWNAAQRRARLDPDKRRPYFLYIDEFQNYVNLPVSFTTVLDEARKYGIPFIVAHHRLSQLPHELREAVMSNARNKLYFGVQTADAAVLSRELPPTTVEDFTLGRFEALARLVIDDEPTPPVTIRTLPPREPTGIAELVRGASQATYGKPLEDVELEIAGRRKVSRQTWPESAGGQEPDGETRPETAIGLEPDDESEAETDD